METTLVAEKAARVAEAPVQVGTQVEAGDLLLRFEGDDIEGVILKGRSGA